MDASSQTINTSKTRLPLTPVRRLIHVIWLVLVLLNLSLYISILAHEYDERLIGEVDRDMHLELVPDSVYSIGEYFDSEDFDEITRRVTNVSDYAAEQGLQVGDVLIANWFQGSQGMPITLSVLSEDGTVQREVTLVASERASGYIVTLASADAQEAGINEGDMITGDYTVPWEGTIGEEIPFFIIPEGETEPTPVTLTRKPWAYETYILYELGISVNLAHIIFTVPTVVLLIITFALAGFIAMKRADDWLALAFAWAITTVPKLVFGETYLPNIHPTAHNDADIFVTVVPAFAILVILAFPNGRLRPRWTVALPVLWVIAYLLPQTVITSISFPTTAILVLVVAIMFYRYSHYLSPTEKQQAKWVGFAFACVALAQLIIAPSTYLYDTNERLGLLYDIVFEHIVVVSLAASALFFIMFAILRHRLWDIDLVINRSLVYGAVALVAIALFFGILFGLQVIVGQTQPVFALAVAGGISLVVFRPLRNRAQHIVDRYLFGLRFDLNELHGAHRRPAVTNPGILTGHVLDGYEVLDVIGKGGMGEIYKGFGNGRTVAIKTMLPEIAADDELRLRFQREAEAGLKLNHPNIAAVFASGDHEGTPYLIMEFVDGEDLSEVLQQQGQLDQETTVSIMRGVCNGLAQAHKQGFIHRDIKPSNIMLRQNGQAVLMDFGVTKVTGATRSLTGTGAVGTIDYMAPEQIMASREVDQRADIYALGVVLYETLTGTRPFTGTLPQVMFAHLQQPAPDPTDANPDVPQEIAKTILTALEKKPEDRFQTIEAFARAMSGS